MDKNRDMKSRIFFPGNENEKSDYLDELWNISESVNRSRVSDEETIHSEEIDSDYTRDTPDLFIEDFPAYVDIIYVTVCVISVLISSFSITALRRTKRIPYSAKFLSTGLLCFDSIYIISITVRKFVKDPLYNTSLNVLSTQVLQLAYVTVALMSLERFLMFKKPMVYIKKCKKTFLHTTAAILWATTIIVFQTVRYGFCYVKFKSYYVFVKAGLCNQIVTFYYASLVVLVLAISMTCYWGIFNIVKRQLANAEKRKISFASTANLLRTYKSTSLVLVYLLVILITSVTYALIITYIKFMNLEVAYVRISLETISMMNCLLDPFLYVMWFKESQMQLLLIFSRFSLCEQKAATMKYQIFDIVTSSTKTSSDCTTSDNVI